MIGFGLDEMAGLLDGRLTGRDLFVHAVSTDTRSLQQGDCFVALQGPNFDGHDYLDTAARRGAAAALVSRQLKHELPLVCVDDTRIGLGRLAQAWRQKANPRLVGVTGSNGKTTLKEMIAAILSHKGRVLATRGNLNNDIGVPLTLLRLQDEDYAVIEMGANHAQEIDYLTHLAQPDVAVLNNAGRAHLEGFGSLQGVARAKAEILNGLADDGVFVFNADDDFADLWRELSAGRRILTFGVQRPADVSSCAGDYTVHWSGEGAEARFESRFEVNTDAGSIELNLRLVGEHNRMNALAATAASLCMGAGLAEIASGLNSLAPVAGRLCPVPGHAGARLIDDSYNANPDSVLAALNVLVAAPGRRTFILGDLGELGADARQLHAELGARAKAQGIDRLLTCGEFSQAATEQFGPGARHFAQQSDLLDAIGASLNAEDSVLIKGSRAAAMERVVQALQQEDRAC